MISTTTSKLKFKDLKRRLGKPEYQVVGVLEALWLFTGHNAITGDVGRFTNAEIAAGLEWEGDPDHLIDSLTESHWLDLNSKHRLVVHGWSEHCPNWVKGVVKRQGLRFAENDDENVINAYPRCPTQGSPPKVAHPEYLTTKTRLDKTRQDKTEEAIPHPSDSAPAPTPKPKEILQDFEEFYEAYPRKVGKKAAQTKYLAARKAAVGRTAILEGLRRYNDHLRRERTETRFIAHPATWLNQGRWDDSLGRASPRDDTRRATDEEIKNLFERKADEEPEPF